MRLKHEIRGRLITIPGISQSPIVFTGELILVNRQDHVEIEARFTLTSPHGFSFDPAGMSYPLEKLYAAIEADQNGL